MKRHTINLITLGLLLLSVSSCNYLDVIPDNVPNIDHALPTGMLLKNTCLPVITGFRDMEVLLTIRLCWEDTRCILITGKRR